MLKLTTLSDAQSELMQGGNWMYEHKCYPKHKCGHKKHGSSHNKTTSINVSQTLNNTILKLGGFGGTISNSVSQGSTIAV